MKTFLGFFIDGFRYRILSGALTMLVLLFGASLSAIALERDVPLDDREHTLSQLSKIATAISDQGLRGHDAAGFSRQPQKNLMDRLREVRYQRPALIEINHIEVPRGRSAVAAYINASLVIDEESKERIRIAVPKDVEPGAELEIVILNIGSNELAADAKSVSEQLAELGLASVYYVSSFGYESARRDVFTQALETEGLDGFVLHSQRHAERLAVLFNALNGLPGVMGAVLPEVKWAPGFKILNIGYAGALAMPFLQLADTEGWELAAIALLDVEPASYVDTQIFKVSLVKHLWSAYSQQGLYRELFAVLTDSNRESGVFGEIIEESGGAEGFEQRALTLTNLDYFDLSTNVINFNVPTMVLSSTEKSPDLNFTKVEASPLHQALSWLGNV